MIFCEYSIQYPCAANPPTGRDPEPSWPLRLPQSKTYYVGGGRREFVFDWGVIGICPPCIRATPLGGRYPSWRVGEVREPCAANPPTGRDPEPSWQGGLLRKDTELNTHQFWHSIVNHLRIYWIRSFTTQNLQSSVRFLMVVLVKLAPSQRRNFLFIAHQIFCWSFSLFVVWSHLDKTFVLVRILKIDM